MSIENLSINEPALNNHMIYYSLGEIEGDLYGFRAESENVYSYTPWLSVVLRDSCSVQELLEELNVRLKTFELSATLEKMADKDRVWEIIAA
ncbi:MAG: hypothetical protein ACI4B5_00570 [Bacteroidaceae bacterium]